MIYIVQQTTSFCYYYTCI